LSAPTFSLRLAALRPLSGRGVRIAVIDSGVHAAHPHVQGVAGGVGIDASGVAHPDYTDRLGHGTAVTAALREKAPAAEILAVKVFDRELATTGDALVAAFQWSRQHGARMITLSLGTSNPDHEIPIMQEVDAAHAAGIIVVAAGPQGQSRRLPGELPGVIAVDLDIALPRDACEIAIGDDGRVTVRASGYPRPIPGVPPERNLKGLSFAVANASGLLACVLEGVPPGKDIRAALERVSSASPSG
jgi:subtilisin family serine protease